jgi:HSP20 family molecular chaperone IbpA
VEVSRATATFKDGVFVVTLPKTPTSQGTMIPVKTE